MDTLNQTKLSESIDDILGSKNNRYFGSGYKRVGYSLHDYKFDTNYTEATLKIHWPEKWASKSSGTVETHLGSLEAFSIAAQMCEIHLSARLNFNKEELSQVWIKELCVKAGSNSTSSEYIMVSAQCVDTSENPDSINGFESKFLIRIGSMKVELKFDHPRTEKGLYNYKKLTEILDESKNSYYTIGYKTHIQQLKNIVVDTANRYTVSDVTLENQEMNEVLKCTGSRFQPCPTFVDAILVSGQLIQVLLYNLDNLNREETNNLWMREIKAVYKKPMVSNSFKSSIKVIDTKNISMAGKIWRLATVKSVLGDNELIGEVKVAHITKQLS